MGSPDYRDVLRAINYSPEQKTKFKHLFDQVKSNEMTMNKAYKTAKSEGYMGADGTFKENFAQWMNTAREEGWIDQSLDIAASLLNKGEPLTQGQGQWGAQQTLPPPPPPKSNTMLWVGLSVVTLIGVGVFIHMSKKD